jgi:hypothetical protein
MGCCDEGGVLAADQPSDLADPWGYKLYEL